jgi:outer membrane lipoprotein carrier protein
LESTYQSARTLQATFLEQYSENGRIVRAEAGTAYFRRPGKMRWEYESSERDVFLVDGKTTWFYVPNDHTVMRWPAKESTDWRTPLALLAGGMRISRVCTRVEAAGTEKPLDANDVVLECAVRGSESKRPRVGASEARPEADAGAQRVFFEVSPDTGELTRILIRQSGGVEVQFQFRNWRFNPPLAESLFHFEPPPGVAIVNGELPTGASAAK